MSRFKYRVSALLIGISVSIVAISGAEAAREKSLYDFTATNGDGSLPLGDLIGDSRGNVYGVTVFGGPTQSGTIFKINRHGAETVLYTFGIYDGADPRGGLLMDAKGDLYGTTSSGGLSAYGVVFKLSRTLQYLVLYSFTGGVDGAGPSGSLIKDVGDNLYGVTQWGGAKCDCGTVFKITPHGRKRTLYSFGGETDGYNPIDGLVLGADGALYGTTERGGDASCLCGTVFKLSADGAKTTLHTFIGGDDGYLPTGQLVTDGNGNLYGVTAAGGRRDNAGTIYRIDTSGNIKILHAFTEVTGKDGYSPNGRLILDDLGDLYGTTSRGGPYDAGTVFEIDASGKERVLYSFTGGADGYEPMAGMVDMGDSFEGTTFQGGVYQEGNIFRLKKRNAK